MRSGACKQIEIMAQHFLDGSEMWNGVPHFGTVQESLPVAYHFFNLSSLGGCGANRHTSRLAARNTGYRRVSRADHSFNHRAY